MKTIFKIEITCVLLFVVVFSVFSQVKYLSNEIIFSLSSRDVEEVQNAYKIKQHGDALMKEAYKTENTYGISMTKIDDYEAEKIRQMDDAEISIIRKTARKKIQASNYYGNYNLIITSVYVKRLKELSKNVTVADKLEIDKLLKKNASLMQTSSLIRREALQMNNELLVYPYLMDAYEIEFAAINNLKKAFLIIYKDAELIGGNDELYINSINTEKGKELYYEIQVAASKVKLSDIEIEIICGFNENITNNFDNGWYKYSINKKFKDYESAFKYKQEINIEGAFITAFINEQKVNISEAINAQNKNNN